MISSRVKYAMSSAVIGLLFIGLFIVPLSNLIPLAFADVNVLTQKWTRSLSSNWEGGLVIGDVTGDGVEDVVFASGGNEDTIYVLNGTNGNTLATWPNSRIAQYCQPQLYDVNGDGVLDILVPLYYQPGLAAVRYDGDSSLQQMWITNTQSGSDPLGSVMAKPVAGDINGDGDLDIFLASQDVSPLGGYDGTIVRLNENGTILATNFAWRACSGGLSLADTDNDGTFEIYQGDRDIDYTDGGYGKGVKSFWADNLTERWNRLDFLSSSQSPVIVDVNGDGVKDVLSGMYSEMNILNSTNGQMIKRWSYGNMSVHYGFTVYDIDADGNLELLCNDGDHDNDKYTDVIDLITGNYDAELYLGDYNSTQAYDNKWGPLVADVYANGNNGNGSPRMEIITGANTTNPSNVNVASLLIFDNSYNLLQNMTGLSGQIGYPFVQDIDGDDLLELVTDSSTGTVYAYDTAMPAPGYSSSLPGSERIRSEVTYFGESRLGVAEHTIMPWEEDYWTAPLVAPVSPADNALAVPISTNHVSFRLRDHQGDSISYLVTTSPDIGTTSGLDVGDPYNWTPYTLDFDTGLDYDTTYRWTVTADDGTGNVTVRTYTFRTELDPAIGNNAPEQDSPSLVALDGGFTTSNFNCSAQETSDFEGDNVTNIYRWTVDGDPVAQLLLPFDTRNETSTKDYSGFGNNGQVIGASWVQNGVMGGAYSFDGKDDAIIVSDGGLGYYNDQNYGSNNEELGGFGNWNAVTVEAWIYLTENNTGSQIVAKIPSFTLGFVSGSINRLYCAVWPYTGEIAEDENQASVDSMESLSASSSSALNLSTWYHVVFTYENGVGLKLYLNGQSIRNGTTDEGPLSESRGEPLYIGRLVQPFAGMIDDVRLYSYALPAAQIYNRYMESKDGNSSSSQFIPFGFGGSGDLIGCDVTPTDSFNDGSTVSATPVEVANTLPVASNPKIYPLRDRIYRSDNEDLLAGYDYYDADGDVESGTQIRWYRNDSLESGFNDFLVIPASNTSIGDVWYFTVTPADGPNPENLGLMQNSSSVTIRSNSAPTTGVPTLDSMNGGTDYDDEDLVGTATGTTDADSDATTNIFHWTNEGVSQTNLQMPFDTESSGYLGTNGIARDYSGYGNNGSVNGSSWIQDGVVGGAFSFDGNDSIRVQEVGSSLGGDGGWSAITVEFWAKTASTSTETVVMMHAEEYDAGDFGVSYRVDYRGRADGYQVYWYIYNSTATNSVNFRVYEGPSQWHHVVCTYKSGVGLKLYTDGTLRASVMASGNINATANDLLDIGGLLSGGTDFVGQMDEVRIYPNALSAAQVYQRYNETKDGLSDSNSIVAQETRAGDDWICQVTPNDSWEDGTIMNSTSLHVEPAAQYNLTIGTTGPGTTDPAPGVHTYAYNANVSIDALPSPGYIVNWIIDGNNMGSADPYVVTINGDIDLTATFIPLFLVDGFESGSFSAWSSTYATSGETAAVVNTTTYRGNYSGRFTSDNGGGYEYVYASKSITSSAELYARGYFYVSQSGIVENQDRFYFIKFAAGASLGSANLAYVGWRKDGSGNVHWHLMIHDGTNVIGTYSVVSPSLNTWYCVELHWKRDSVAGFGELYVDGVLVCSLTNRNTYDQGSAGAVRFGLPEIYLCTNTTAYADNCIIFTAYIGPEPPAEYERESMYLVHVGVNGDMFWGGVNVSDSSFSGWNMLPGKASLSVASAVSDGRLYVAHVGVNNDMFWGSVNLTDSSFSGWTMLPGKTPLSVALTASDGKICLVHVGVNGDMFWGSVNLTDSSFSGWTTLPGKASLSVSATASDERLCVVHVGVNNDMFWGSVNLTDSSFSGWAMLPGKTGLSVTTAAFDGNLYVVHVGVNNDMFWGSVNLTDSTFTSWAMLPGKTDLRAAVTAFGGQLYVVHVGVNNDMFWGSVDLSDSIFSGWTMLPGKTPLPVSAA